MKKIIIAVMFLAILFSGCITSEENNMVKLYASGKNVTITENGWEEGSKVHHYIYKTDAGYVLNMPGQCEDMGCVGKNVTVGGSSVYYDSYYDRNEMTVNWNGRPRGWF